SGDLEEIETMMLDDEKKFRTMPVYEHIFDHYHHITTHWYGYMSAEDQEKQDAMFREKMPGIEQELRKMTGAKKTLPAPTTLRPGAFAKTGRNDPCPCGSGKKYKKCCWGK
ncbi:MAG: SEC-C domain-containing protein, partial [Lewinella sp.]|nr:SEC-C domain-containing protein [Lewinella sp.]